MGGLDGENALLSPGRPEKRQMQGASSIPRVSDLGLREWGLGVWVLSMLLVHGASGLPLRSYTLKRDSFPIEPT